MLLNDFLKESSVSQNCLFDSVSMCFHYYTIKSFSNQWLTASPSNAKYVVLIAYVNELKQ